MLSVRKKGSKGGGKGRRGAVWWPLSEKGSQRKTKIKKRCSRKKKQQRTKKQERVGGRKA